jgi:hypothetical protein
MKRRFEEKGCKGEVKSLPWGGEGPSWLKNKRPKANFDHKVEDCKFNITYLLISCY